jgi:hypothetical protein
MNIILRQNLISMKVIDMIPLISWKTRPMMRSLTVGLRLRHPNIGPSGLPDTSAAEGYVDSRTYLSDGLFRVKERS